MARRALPGETNYDVFDRWSLAHAFVGGVLQLSGLSIGQALVASVAWEAMEPGIKTTFPSIFPSQSLDSMQNKAGDIVS